MCKLFINSNSLGGHLTQVPQNTSLTLRSGHSGRRTTLVRRGPWTDPGCCRWGSGMVADSSVCARPLSDSAIAALITFVLPRPNRHTQGRVATDGSWFTTTPTRCIPAIGISHQHSSAQALFQVSARGYTRPHIGTIPHYDFPHARAGCGQQPERPGYC